jgi:predicted nucleic acid-binding protein
VTPTDFAQGAPLFVDTNVFLRFLTNDVPEQAAAVEGLFRRAAAGEVRLVTNTTVVAEIVTEALLAYAESAVDFIDAYNACWMRQVGLSRVATFDRRHYSRFEGIAIHTPGEE